jgi:hypothetical protein
MSTSAVMPEVKVVPAKPGLFDSALLLVISKKWIPTSKTVKATILSTTADMRMISVQKKLYDSPELRKIWQLESQLDAFMKYRASPFPLQKGHFLVPADLYHDVENKLTEHLEKRNILIDEFVAAYQTSIDKAKELLGDQFNEMDYPSSNRVKEMFDFKWNYLEFTVSDKLKELDKAVAEKKEQQWQSQIIQASEAAEKLLTEQMAELVNHLAGRLAPTGEVNEDGSEKVKVFREKSFDKLKDFLSVLPARNLTQNKELDKLAQQVRDLIQGVNPTALKSNEALKSSVADGFKQVKESLASMITNQKVRAISFED